MLDASLTLSWFFEDEITEETEQLQALMTEGAEALCPPHWPLEVANSLLMAERKKLSQASKTAQFLSLLSHLRILVKPGDAGSGNSLLLLGREQGLTVYDAAYLELAMQSGMPLGTLDGALRQAAGRVGVALLPVNAKFAKPDKRERK